MTTGMLASASIVIPNYNGSGMIGECLASLPPGLPVVVVDDASTDDSLHVIRERFPDVMVIARRENGGFSKAMNDGIRAASGDLVIAMNNDVETPRGFLDSILPLFDDEDVFAVSPRVVLPKRDNLDEGCKTGFWHHGMFYVDQLQGVGQVRPILYATACAAVYRRSMLEELGGFDEAYSPFYWEDADLGYRAWKRGWKSLYQPESLVYHQHSASISRVKPTRTDRIKARNNLFFVWRNIDDPALVARHRRWLPIVLARRAVVGDSAFVGGWRDAFDRRNEASVALGSSREHRKLSDREIFAAVGISMGEGDIQSVSLGSWD